MSFIYQLLQTESVARLGITLLHSLWQLSLLAVLFKLFLSTLHKHNAQFRYWGAMAFLFLAISIPTSTFLVVNIDRTKSPVPSQPVQVVTTAHVDDSFQNTSLPVGHTTSDANSNIEAPFAVPVMSHFESASTCLRDFATWLSPFATLLWILGVIACSVRPFASLLRVFRLKSTAQTNVNNQLQNTFSNLTAKIRLRRPVQIAKSSLVCVPTVVGFFRPLVLLPASALTGLKASELEAIILHELAHLKRWDDVFVLAQSVVETLLFFHPAIWWISSVAREERENCCDDMATEAIKGNSSLASALLALVDMNNERYRTKLNTSANTNALAATGGKVIDRVRRLSEAEPRQPVTARWIGGLVSLGLIVLLSIYASFAANSANAQTVSESGAELVIKTPPATESDDDEELTTKPNYKKFQEGTYVLTGRVMKYRSRGPVQTGAGKEKLHFHEFEFTAGKQLLGKYIENVAQARKLAGLEAKDKCSVSSLGTLAQKELSDSMTENGAECIFVLEPMKVTAMAGTIPVRLLHVEPATPEMLKVARHAVANHQQTNDEAKAQRADGRWTLVQTDPENIPKELLIVPLELPKLPNPTKSSNVDPAKSVYLNIEGKRVLTHRSPMGGRVVFDRTIDGKRQIYTANPKGNDIQKLTHGKSDFMPCWSPDGKRIAFCSNRSGVYQVYEMDSDGKNLKQLTKHKHGARRPVYSSTGWLAYEKLYEQKGKSLPRDMILTNFKEEIVVLKKNYISEYSWSNDGSVICVGAANEINFYDITTKNMTTVNVSEQDKRLYAHALSDIAWSPDMKKIAGRIRFLGGRVFPAGATEEDMYVFGDTEVFVVGRDGSFEFIAEKDVPKRAEKWIKNRF